MEDKGVQYLVDSIKEAISVRIRNFKRTCHFHVEKPKVKFIAYMGFPFETIKTEIPELWAVLQEKGFELEQGGKKVKK